MAVTATQLNQLYLAYFGRPADFNGLNFYLNQANATLDSVAAAFSASPESQALYGTSFGASQVNAIYQNLFNRDAEVAGLTYWSNEVNSGRLTAAKAAWAILVGAQNDDLLSVNNKLAVNLAFTNALDTAAEIVGYNGTTAAASARAFIATVTSTAASLATATAGLDAAVASAIAAGGAATNPGQTFTLTTAADTLTGTSGNDTFVGLVDGTTAANSTLSAVDTINGSTGTVDTLNITTQGAGAVADAANGALISGVETLNLRATGTGGVTLAAGNIAGMTTLNNNLSTDAVTITGLGASTALVITGNGVATNGATTVTKSGTAGALTVTGGVNGGAVAVTGANFTSFTVNSTGAVNTLGALSTTGSANVATVTINATTALLTTGLTVDTATAGNQTLVVSGAAADRAASASSAARSAVTLGALDADFVSVNASGLTAGGVSATLSATTTATFVGGAGADRITTSTSAQTGSIDAGAGTDILTLAATGHIDTTAEGAIYKGFEVLAVADAVSIDMDLITGSTIGAVVLADAAGATVVTDMTATQAANFTIAALTGAATIGIKNATTVATLDTLAITVSDGDTTTSEAIAGTGDLTIAGVETITINAVDDITLASMANVSGMTSLTVSGTGDVSITTGAMAVTANTAVSFAGLTTAATFNAAAATGNAIGFTGGSGVDTVTDSAIGGNVIVTGAGRDVITLTAKTGGTSANQITGGAGGDSLTVTAAKGNAANEQIVLKYAAGDSVIDSSIAGTGFVAATMDAITGLDLATAAAAGAGHVVTFDTVQSATAVTFSSAATVFGTTTVTNAFDFLVYNTGAGGVTYVYQDTDGDKIIENGEFGVQLTGVAATATAAGEFTVTAGNLVLSTLVG